MKKECNPGVLFNTARNTIYTIKIMLRVFLVVFNVYYQFVNKVHLLVVAAQNANVSDWKCQCVGDRERDVESRRKGGEKCRTRVSSPDK